MKLCRPINDLRCVYLTNGTIEEFKKFIKKYFENRTDIKEIVVSEWNTNNYNSNFYNNYNNYINYSNESNKNYNNTNHIAINIINNDDTVTVFPFRLNRWYVITQDHLIKNYSDEEFKNLYRVVIDI